MLGHFFLHPLNHSIHDFQRADDTLSVFQIKQEVMIGPSEDIPMTTVGPESGNDMVIEPIRIKASSLKTKIIFKRKNFY